MPVSGLARRFPQPYEARSISFISESIEALRPAFPTPPVPVSVMRRAAGSASQLGNALGAADGMEALRTAASHVPASYDIEQGAVRLTGALSVFAAAWARVRAGQLPIAPHPSLSHAADYLQMLSGAVPEPRAGARREWCAHVDEQRRVGRLIRPASRNVGPAPEVEGIRISRRI
jgi:citrate synthase